MDESPRPEMFPLVLEEDKTPSLRAELGGFAIYLGGARGPTRPESSSTRRKGPGREPGNERDSRWRGALSNLEATC